eukprot:COSAG06_NODE_4739_length_3990_cov_5.171678_2_plen_214_part_00
MATRHFRRENGIARRTGLVVAHPLPCAHGAAASSGAHHGTRGWAGSSKRSECAAATHSLNDTVAAPRGAAPALALGWFADPRALSPGQRGGHASRGRLGAHRDVGADQLSGLKHDDLSTLRVRRQPVLCCARHGRKSPHHLHCFCMLPRARRQVIIAALAHCTADEIERAGGLSWRRRIGARSLISEESRHFGGFQGQAQQCLRLTLLPYKDC